MCGIVGIFSAKMKDQKFSEKTREVVIRALSTLTMTNLQERGRDASGAFVHFDNGEWMAIKQPVPASEMTLNTGGTKQYPKQEEGVNFQSFINRWRNTSENKSCTRVMLGHVRKKTQGSEYNPDNNHPIKVGNILGVHNGGITNDDVIFKLHPELKRIGEVDSEALFQMMMVLSNESAPSISMLEELDTKLRGTYAILGTNLGFPGVVGSMRRTRPLEYCMIEKFGLIITVSEKIFVNAAIGAYNRLVLSVSGGAYSLIKESDVKWTFIPDDTAVLFDVSNEVDNLSECVKEKKMGYAYSVQDDNYNTVYTGHTGYNYNKKTTYNTDTFGSRSPVADKSKAHSVINRDVLDSLGEICDMTSYSVGGASTDTGYAVATTVTANIVDEDDSDDNNDNEYSRKSIDMDEERREQFLQKREEGRASIARFSEMFELFGEGIDELTISEKMSVSTEGLDASLLSDAVMDAWEEGFSDGWACNSIRTNGSLETETTSAELKELITSLVNTNRKLSKAKRSLSGFIGNMKKALFVLLTYSASVDVHKNQKGRYEAVIDSTFLADVRQNFPDFLEDGFINMIASESDVEKIKDLLGVEDSDYDTDSGDDSAFVTGTKVMKSMVS